MTYVPFYDKCKTLLNVLGDVHGRDTHRDGNASEFAAVYNECLVSDRNCFRVPADVLASALYDTQFHTMAQSHIVNHRL